MWVSEISMEGTEYHPGGVIRAQALVHWNMLDLGDYRIATYYRKKNASKWSFIAFKEGTLNWGQNPHWVSVPDFNVPSTYGEYEFGVIDWGNLETFGSVEAVMQEHQSYLPFSVTPQPPPGMGQLNIYSYPEGASVYLDGTPIGETNIIGYNVDVGRHEVRLSKWGYKEYTEYVTVDEGKTVPISATLKSSFAPEELVKYVPLVLGGIVVGTVVVVAASPKARNKIKSYFTE